MGILLDMTHIPSWAIAVIPGHPDHPE